MAPMRTASPGAPVVRPPRSTILENLDPAQLGNAPQVDEGERSGVPEFPFRQQRVTARKEHGSFVATAPSQGPRRRLPAAGNRSRPVSPRTSRNAAAAAAWRIAAQNLLGMQWHVQMRHAERGQRVQDGVDDGRRCPDGPRLTDSLDPETR